MDDDTSKSLIDYEKNLEELEKQREKLQRLMQMMGQEWEESGPGIKWLEQVIDLPNTQLDDLLNDTTTTTTIATETIPTTTMKLIDEPLFNHLLTAQTGPSPEYLQSLLNVNEALLAESLANNSPPPLPEPTTTASLTPTEEDLNTPLMTPEDAVILQKNYYGIDANISHLLNPSQDS